MINMKLLMVIIIVRIVVIVTVSVNHTLSAQETAIWAFTVT